MVSIFLHRALLEKQYLLPIAEGILLIAVGVGVPECLLAAEETKCVNSHNNSVICMKTTQPLILTMSSHGADSTSSPVTALALAAPHTTVMTYLYLPRSGRRTSAIKKMSEQKIKGGEAEEPCRASPPPSPLQSCCSPPRRLRSQCYTRHFSLWYGRAVVSIRLT